MRGCFKNEKELPQFIIGYDDYCPFNYINDQVKQDGTITCKSTKDVGTTFLVESTFKKDLTPIQKESKPKDMSQLLVGKKVLLVEDHELNMEMAAFILEEKGMHITQAFNGQIALDLFKNSDLNEFDFILMDMMIPIMNGLVATRQICLLEREDAKTIPIIAMSANAFEDDVENSLNAGMNGHIAKLVDVNKLVNTLSVFGKGSN